MYYFLMLDGVRKQVSDAEEIAANMVVRDVSRRVAPSLNVSDAF